MKSFSSRLLLIIEAVDGFYGMMAKPKALETEDPLGLRTVTVRELARALEPMVILTFNCVELT